MKQVLRSMAVIALTAFAASCAKEQTDVPSGGETTVCFSIASPVLQTRAIADGNKVDKVDCCVYDSDGNYVAGTEANPISQTIGMENGNATFSVRLVTGQKYSFIFWAYEAPGEGATSPYTLDKTNKTVTVSYDNAASNDESRDAFYAYVGPVTIKGSLSQTVELTRPFAQLNFGVEKDDIVAAKAANIEVSKSKVKLTGLGTELNLVSGEVTGNETAEFALADCPTEDLTVNSTDYGYVAMNYILVGKDDQSLTDATLYLADASSNLIKEDGLEVSNVPVRGNYRTNVLGNLFTSQVITNINVNPAFDEDIVKIIEVADVASANTAIEANKASEVIDVKFVSAPDDAAEKAILTTPVKENGTLNVEIASSTETLYVGDYASATVEETMQTEAANAATVNITVPENVTITKLVINAPSKSVYINGVNASDYSGTQITTLEATTSDNTLVIEEGQTVEKLIFHKGGLEIHGTVNAVEIAILEEDKNKDPKEVVIVRDCENLSNDVYTVLEGYIATGYVAVQGRTTEGLWDIVNTKPSVTSESELVAAVADANVVEVTVKNNIALTAPLDVAHKLTLDLNGKTLSPASAWSSDSADDALIMVKRGGDLTITGEGTIDTGDNSRFYAAVKLTKKGETATGEKAKLTIENGTFKGYHYAICGNGTRHDTELTIDGGDFSHYYYKEDASAIYLPMDGTYEINGGTFTSYNAAIELRAGTLTVTGGTFNATSETFSATANGSGTTVVGAALAVSQHTTDKDINVTVTGGTFNGIYALYEDDLQNETGNVTVSVSGGTLNGMVYSKHNTDINVIKAYAIIPEGPDMSGSTVNVTAANAQFVLDGAYGSIDGRTINFTENISTILVFGRPTKFAGSNTKYMVGGYTSAATGYLEFATSEELVAHKNQSIWTRGCYYLRSIKDVTFTANEGVTIEGIVASSGHVHVDKGGTPAYDYVRDSGKWVTEGSVYYSAYNFENIKFEGISFNKDARFSKNGDGESPSTVDGITFHKCKFLKYSTTGRQRIWIQNNSDALSYAFRNITVDECTFDTSYQGIYTQYAKNITVKNSTFTTTGHNAIAIQSYNGNTPDMGAVVITGNTFTGIGDRVIRFGNLGSDTQITITGNTSSADSHDTDGEVIKAGTVSEGVTYTIENNSNWTLKDAAALIYIIQG